MDDEERFEMLLEVLDELRLDNETIPVLVEGLRDITALRLLGLTGDVRALNAGATLFNLAESIATSAREVILLTDWDTKGQQLFDAMSANLSANGVRVVGTYRDDLRHWIRPTLKDIESLASYVGRNLARYHRKDLGEM